MHFGPCPVERAIGATLVHSVRLSGATFRKGRILSGSDIAELRASGLSEIVVARLEPGDIDEDEAARRIAAGCGGEATRTGSAVTGRANLYAGTAGLAVVDTGSVEAINRIHESITIATVTPYSRVTRDQMIATVKIIPFAVSDVHVASAEYLLRGGPLVRVAAFTPLRAALISTMLPGDKHSLVEKGRKAVEDRLTSIGSMLVSVQHVSHDAGSLSNAICKVEGADLILVLGSRAIADRRDIVPAAIEAAGGTVATLGMPVDPGNLLLTGHLFDVPVIGLPGCARSLKLNGFDWVLWRLAAGLPVGREDISGMGVGGLLAEIHSRPQPRGIDPSTVGEPPKIGAIVLAAGLSSRMGSNKLLAEIAGKPVIRQTVEAALASRVEPILVVTGSDQEKIRSALAGLNVQFTNNPDFSKGLSASLKHGLSSLPGDCDAVVILLGDMPGISPSLIDRMIAAFDPAEGRAICVATRDGKRGNPVLWAKGFFPDIMAIQGDVGAKHVMTANDEMVCEVEADDDGPLIDIDTPEALAAYRAR